MNWEALAIARGAEIAKLQLRIHRQRLANKADRANLAAHREAVAILQTDLSKQNRVIEGLQLQVERLRLSRGV